MPYIRNAWYCAALSEELGSEPVGRTFLDQPLVLFRRLDGTVAAMSDVCPHRFAPLHGGLRDGDTIRCPYHGLVFDSHGACVHNPHGSGRIPPGSTLTTYPVAERQGIIWVWMGDAERADPASIIELRLIGEAKDPPLGGYLKMKADYQLIIDNLLDLNHAPYLHPGTLSPRDANREARFERGRDTAAAHYVMRAVPTPTSQRLWFHEPVGDYHVSMEWAAPSILLQSIIMTGAGRPPTEGAVMHAAHLLVPETRSTTHYFWVATRNRLVNDRDVDAKLRAIVEQAFLKEDGPMIEACQKNMQGRDFEDLKPVFLETDVAAGHARSVLRKLIESERRR